MQDFKDLKVWQKSHQLVLDVYKASAEFPQQEIYALTNQIRRASASIATNIAEGCGQVTEPQFARFLGIALGSASEVEYLLHLSHDLNYLEVTQATKLGSNVVEVKKMLFSLLQRVSSKN